MGTEGLGWVEIRGIVVPRNEFWHKRRKKKLRDWGGLGSAWQALVWTDYENASGKR